MISLASIFSLEAVIYLKKYVQCHWNNPIDVTHSINAIGSWKLAFRIASREKAAIASSPRKISAMPVFIFFSWLISTVTDIFDMFLNLKIHNLFQLLIANSFMRDITLMQSSEYYVNINTDLVDPFFLL